MDKKKEEMIEKLRNVKQTAEAYLKTNNFENYVIRNVVHYNKKVELINKETNKKEEFELYAVIAQNANPEIDGEEIFELEYLENKEGKIFTISDLIQEYEGFESIKDVVDKTKENKRKPKEEQDEELRIEDLNELESEKEQEEKKPSEKKEKKEADKSDLTGKRPKHVIQTIDIDKAYVDNWTTVRKGFNLPAGVEKIAIATPIQKDDNILSSTMTIYMLDNSGNIVESINGKTIEDFLEIDDATGSNPLYDDNTKLELEGYAEKNKGQTMRRFRSKADPELYLSAEQKRVGGYVEVYAGRRTRDGNDPVEVQLETDNVGIQTSFEMQELISEYRGEYNKENIDKEADIHEGHGDDEDVIAIENADGNKLTRKDCPSPFIPGTDKTWEELSRETGEGIKKLQERFDRELRNGKRPTDIVEEIEYDYEMTGHEHRH